MYIKHLNTVVFFAGLIAVTIFAGLLLAPFAGAIFFATVLAIIFYPTYLKLSNKVKGRQALASALMCVFITVMVVLPLVAIAAMVVGETTNVLNRIDLSERSLSDVKNYLRNLPLTIPGIPTEELFSEKNLAAAGKKITSGVLNIAQKTYTEIINALIGVFVLFFTLFYLFTDGKKMVRKLMYLSPLSDKHEKLLFERFSSMTRATLKGTIIVGIIQGILGGLAFWIAGVPSAIIWTVVMTIFAIIPMVGTGIVGFPAALFYLLTGNIGAGIFLLAAFIFISLFDNYLRPIIVGKDVQMHTLLVFFATFGGIMSFGLIGFIIGPIIMALFVTLWEIYAIEFRKQLEKYNA